MNQSLSKALDQQNRRLFLFAGLFFIVSIPIAALFVGATVSVSVSPDDASLNYDLEVTEGVSIPYFEKQLVLTSAVSYRISSPGFYPQLVRIKTAKKTPELAIQLLPLPGVVEVQVNTTHAFVLKVGPPKARLLDSKKYIYEIPAGPAEFLVEGANLKTLRSETIVKGRGRAQKVILEPKTLFAMLVFKTIPKQVKVTLNGIQHSSSEGAFRLNLRSGDNELIISHEGYKTFRKKIALSSVDNISLGRLELEPNRIPLQIKSSPSGAAVLLERTFIGETPLEIQVLPLVKHNLEVNKAGFEKVSAVIRPQVGKSITKSYQLSSIRYMLKLDSSVPASIGLNGDSIGRTPLELLVSEGDKITLKAEGYATERINVATSHAQSTKLDVQMVLSERKAYVDSPDSHSLAGLEFKKIRGTDGYSVAVPAVMIGTVKIPDLYVSKTEVTQGSFARFLGKPDAQNNKLMPITNVSWEQAAQYCNWLSKRDGLSPFYRTEEVAGVDLNSIDERANGYRLPTMVEWLYLTVDDNQNQTKGSRKLSRGIGNVAGREALSRQFRYFENYADEYPGLAPVASFRPNSKGLFDVVGNAREWLHNSAGRSSKYFGSDKGMERLAAGSGFKSGSEDELDMLYYVEEVFSKDDLGFRVVREIR
jgi:hypothetical protein